VGRQIVRVPVDFKHPTDDTGEYIPGAQLVAWFVDQGVSHDAADALLKSGFASSFVIRSNGDVQSRIEGGKIPKGSGPP
jgi:hypothetical protein